MPSARAAKVSAMRWRSTGAASATTSSIDGAAVRRAARGRGRPASSAWLARGPGPQAMWLARVVGRCRSSGRPARTSFEDRLDHAFADRHAAHQALCRQQFGRRSAPASACPRRCRWSPAASAARRRDRDSRRRSAAGSGRAAPRAADRCLPAPAGSASPARGTACGRG